MEAVPELTLSLLNEATQAWLELEYNRSPHSEIGNGRLRDDGAAAVGALVVLAATTVLTAVVEHLLGAAPR
jgi:hypothetical protein